MALSNGLQPRGLTWAARAAARRLWMCGEWVCDQRVKRTLGIAAPHRSATPLPSSLSDDYHPYCGTRYLALRKELRAADLRPDDVLVDFGAGEGRVAIYAASRYPLRATIGVELSSELAALARNNVARCRDRLRCRNVQIVEMDATDYVVDDRATVMYFANPFSGGVLERVLDNIGASLARSPRNIRIVSHLGALEQPPSRCDEELQACPWLSLRASVRGFEFLAHIYGNTRWGGSSAPEGS